MNGKHGPCNARDCGNPFTRLYPCGWRCEDHRPVPAPVPARERRMTPDRDREDRS